MNPDGERIDRSEGASRRELLVAGGAAAIASLGARQALMAADATGNMKLDHEVFGKLADGTTIDLFTLANASGLEAKVMTLGATLTTVRAPDRDGQLAIITLYLDRLEDYVRGHPLFGSVVGRYANRIAGARFSIDGREYRLSANAGKHHIHGGGKEALHNAVWKAQPLRQPDAVGVRLTHLSPDGEAGYPGTLQVAVLYKLTADNRLIMDYTAETDRPTHVNLTNHAYWNLAGAGSGDVLKHLLYLNAGQYLVVDREKIPTGQIRSVKGTVMDFTEPRAIGLRIGQVEDRNYDHCYVLNSEARDLLEPAARVLEPGTGRFMEVYTTQPGVQLYTARGLSDRLRGGGKPYGPYHGLCLETQHYPDSPNQPTFPSTLLRPGQTYRQTTVHRFGVQR